MRRLTIEHCHQLATERGGKCLSKTYVNNKSNLRWKCDCCSHIWFAKYNDVQQGHWCPLCAGVAKLSIDHCHKLAAKNGGKCLSSIYIDNRTKIKWQCSCGYIWATAYYSVQQGHWCFLCGLLKTAKGQNNSQVIPHWKTGEELICVASYEIATVLWLNEQKINFLWQPETFVTDILTPTGKRSTYRPDLYLVDTYLWIEIKGYFYEDAKEKWDWFQVAHPNSELWNQQKLIQLGIL